MVMPRATALALRSGARVVHLAERLDGGAQHGEAGGEDAVVVGEQDLQGHPAILADAPDARTAELVRRAAGELEQAHGRAVPGQRHPRAPSRSSCTLSRIRGLARVRQEKHGTCRRSAEARLWQGAG